MGLLWLIFILALIGTGCNGEENNRHVTTQSPKENNPEQNSTVAPEPITIPPVPRQNPTPAPEHITMQPTPSPKPPQNPTSAPEHTTMPPSSTKPPQKPTSSPNPSTVPATTLDPSGGDHHESTTPDSSQTNSSDPNPVTTETDLKPNETEATTCYEGAPWCIIKSKAGNMPSVISSIMVLILARFFFADF